MYGGTEEIRKGPLGLTPAAYQVFFPVLFSFIAWSAGLVFPAWSSFNRRNNARNAKDMIGNIHFSVSKYYSEYGRYPALPSEHDESIPVRTAGRFMGALMGSEQESKKGGLNPRRIMFFQPNQGKSSILVPGVLSVKGGGGQVIDPWGNHYFILLDGDGNGQVKVPSGEFPDSGETIAKNVLVWSAGPDGKSGSEDDVVSWRE